MRIIFQQDVALVSYPFFSKTNEPGVYITSQRVSMEQFVVFM